MPQFLFLIFILSLVLSLLISFFSLILSEKNPDKEKVSSYECGFTPIHIPGKPFSIRFFLISILFLIFDLEITYLFPWAKSTNLINLQGQFVLFLFILFLILGLIYEWIRGGLDWE
uniref:NADH dehydrogenase subunit 3 n=1 Tax=Craseoa lathetica TaxID=316205 RepID=UPI0026E1A145|nr:NADH dehydrogenase subunit 3 [Craseoa lathetica]WJJ70143.1 NADH dehydrogenase subunit 3 [Craseoa lathetica]